MSNSNRATRVVKLSFAELVSSAPVASRGGGRSSDPNHCHYTVNQHRLSFPQRVLDAGYKSGFVTIIDGNLFAVLSTLDYRSKGKPFTSLHQRSDCRHLTIPENSAVTEFLAQNPNLLLSTDPVESDGGDADVATFSLTV